MADFQSSTHRARWIFTPEELVGKYKAANQRAVQTLEKYGATLMEVDVDGTLSYPKPQVNGNGSHIFQEVLSTLVGDATSSKKYNTLEFDLIVYAPYRSIEGFVNDMEDAAKMEVDKIMLTDAPLLFPPGQLALAALRSANHVCRVADFERYLSSILSRQSSAHTISELVEFLNAIDSWAKRYKFPSDKDLKHINRKLKSCWGLSTHDESKKRDKKSKHKSKRSSNEAQILPSRAQM
ncbi:unnamed protein product [Malus baccata var. baccata]